MGQGKGNIYAVMLAATTWVVSGSLLSPVYALYIRDLGASAVQIGLIFSLRAFLPLILRIPLSLVGERVGRVRMLFAGLVVSVTASTMYAYAGSFTHVLLISLYESLSSGSFNQIAMSIVSDMAPADRQGDAMGRYLTFLGLGMLLGPALCSVLVTTFSYQKLFLVSAGFPVAGLALLALWAPRVTGAARSTEEPVLSVGESLRMILGNRNVLLLSYCRASFATSQSLFFTLFSLYANEELHMNESTIAMLFTLRGLTNTLARFPAGRISDRIGRKKPMIAAYGLLVVSFMMTALTRNVTLIAVAMIFYGLSWGTRAVSEWAFLTDLVEPEVKSLSISYLSSVFSLGATVGSVLAGALTVFMPYTGIFMLAGAIVLPPIPAIMMMRKRDINQIAEPASPRS